MWKTKTPFYLAHTIGKSACCERRRRIRVGILEENPRGLSMGKHIQMSRSQVLAVKGLRRGEGGQLFHV